MIQTYKDTEALHASLYCKSPVFSGWIIPTKVDSVGFRCHVSIRIWGFAQQEPSYFVPWCKDSCTCSNRLDENIEYCSTRMKTSTAGSKKNKCWYGSSSLPPSVSLPPYSLPIPFVSFPCPGGPLCQIQLRSRVRAKTGWQKFPVHSELKIMLPEIAHLHALWSVTGPVTYR